MNGAPMVDFPPRRPPLRQALPPSPDCPPPEASDETPDETGERAASWGVWVAVCAFLAVIAVEVGVLIAVVAW